MRPIFAAEGVSKRFGDRVVLRGASMWARPATIHALMGRNGSGKSTLLRCAIGQLRMDSGVVHFAGRSYLRPRLRDLARRGLYYLPSSAELPWSLTLRQAAEWVRRRYGGDHVEPVFDAMRLAGFEDAWPYELSGGEQRRAAVAIAMVRQPAVLLADEPFAGIAPLDAELIAGGLRQIAERGGAVIVTGHDVEQVFAVADEVTWLTGGTSHGLGTPEQCRRHDQFVREYLGGSGAQMSKHWIG